jgi:hypothetical protein
MYQAIVEMLSPLVDGVYAVFQVLGLVYAAIVVAQLVLCVGLVAIALHMLGERLVRRVRAAFARPSTAPGAAVGVGSKL